MGRTGRGRGNETGTGGRRTGREMVGMGEIGEGGIEMGAIVVMGIRTGLEEAGGGEGRGVSGGEDTNASRLFRSASHFCFSLRCCGHRLRCRGIVSIMIDIGAKICQHGILYIIGIVTPVRE